MSVLAERGFEPWFLVPHSNHDTVLALFILFSSLLAILGLMHTQKSLVIINVDIGPCMVDSQLRMTLQWLSASEAEVAELRFDEAAPNELVLVSNKSAVATNRDWPCASQLVSQ